MSRVSRALTFLDRAILEPYFIQNSKSYDGATPAPAIGRSCPGTRRALSGPLNWLNAILALLRPLDRYRAPSVIESAMRRPCLALARINTQVGVLNRLSKPLRGLNRAIVAL